MGTFANIKDFQADNRLENEGIELDFGHGRFITVARSGGGNRRYRAALSEEYKKHKSVLERGAMAEEDASDMLRRVFAKTVVLDWRGWVDAETGEEMPFSQDACMSLFEEAPEIFRVIQDESEKFANFAIKEAEEAGN